MTSTCRASSRMLAAHAQNLGLKHLPKGVLSTEDDMALFGGYSQ